MLLLAEIVTDFLLGIASYLDYKFRKIPVVLPMAGILAGCIVYCICRNREMWELLAGLFPGGVMLFMALLTGEKVGYGDGLMLLALGVLLPMELCIISFCVALVLGAAAGCVLLIMKKASGKSTVPFLPFLLLGYVITLGVYG